MIFTSSKLEKESLKIFNMFSNGLSDKAKKEAKQTIVQYVKQFHKLGCELEKQNKTGELEVLEALKEEMQIQLTLKNNQKMIEIYSILIAFYHILRVEKVKISPIISESEQYLHKISGEIDAYIK